MPGTDSNSGRCSLLYHSLNSFASLVSISTYTMKIPRPFCAMFPSPHLKPRRRAELRRHLAEIIAFTEVGAGAAQDVVSCRRVELYLQHREVIQVVLTLELPRLATHRNRDNGIVLPVELIRAQPLQKVDGFVDARMHLSEAVILIGEGRQA